jgi:hypothetical protein
VNERCFLKYSDNEMFINLIRLDVNFGEETIPFKFNGYTYNNTTSKNNIFLSFKSGLAILKKVNDMFDYFEESQLIKRSLNLYLKTNYGHVICFNPVVESIDLLKDIISLNIISEYVEYKQSDLFIRKEKIDKIVNRMVDKI